MLGDSSRCCATQTPPRFALVSLAADATRRQARSVRRIFPVVIIRRPAPHQYLARRKNYREVVINQPPLRRIGILVANLLSLGEASALLNNLFPIFSTSFVEG